MNILTTTILLVIIKDVIMLSIFGFVFFKVSKKKNKEAKKEYFEELKKVLNEVFLDWRDKLK